jgi:hypothetical protein
MHAIMVRHFQASPSGRIPEAKEIREFRFRKIALRTKVQEKRLIDAKDEILLKK